MKAKFLITVFIKAVCYQMKATRKYKGKNNSVTVEFEFD